MKPIGLIPLMVCLLALLVSSGCMDESIEGPGELDKQLDAALVSASGGEGKWYYRLPASDDFNAIPQDPRNPLTTDKVMLGQLLYHETGLANVPKHTIGKGTYSCASCHFASAGFQAGRHQGIGDGGSGFGVNGENRTAEPAVPLEDCDVQPIRTPTVLNGAFQQNMLWNGQFGATGANIGTEYAWTPGTPKEVNNLGFQGLETQAIAGLTVHRMELDSVLIFSTAYQELFDRAFAGVALNERYTLENAGLAIAAFERTVLANRAPFQQWIDGDVAAMTEDEKRGAILFFGKGECTSCHNGPALNSMEFHALGMNDLSADVGAINVDPADAAHIGRGGFTGLAEDAYKFKVPQLYNLKDSPFYGHGSSFNSVYDVLVYKNAGQAQNANVPANQLAEAFHPLDLSEEELQQLTLFIENSLKDPNLERFEPVLLPSGNCFPNNDQQSKIDLGC